MPRLSSLSSRGLVNIALPSVANTVGVFYSSQGGYYAGRIDYSNGAGTTVYDLYLSPGSAQNNSISYGLTTAITTSFIDGWANTNSVNNSNYPAAQYTRSLTTNGFSDWYIPAYWEMQVLLYNIKSENINNFVGTYNIGAQSVNVGANSYAVPPTGQYTLTVPAQIATPALQVGGADEFSSTNFYGFWTSTQRGGIFDMQNITGTAQNNGGWGNFGSDFKNGTKGVRPIRRVAI